ncbi:hybrid sensor histidine kinase/response regulator [Crenalkalicoccus roseus]|uniref:hybrid sensor histidine kinase/response regulator n=1 Tax=Crenalkalicoccus roseus TaxID=1485588 RepID=UPI0010803E10|nr:response regulator [Crenalkalicoccus roseus]
MEPDLRQELLAVFEAEHREHLGVLRALLEEAERGLRPDLREASRRAHTLKGAARAVDLPAIEQLAHRLETLFEGVEAGARALDAGAIGAVQRALDAIEGHVAALAGGAEPPAPRGALAALDRLLGTAAPEAPPPPAEPPPAEPPPAAAPPAEPPAPAEYLRVGAEQVDRLGGAVHGLVAALQRRAGHARALRELEGEARSLARAWEELRRRAAPARPAERARLEALGGGIEALARRLAALARAQQDEAFALDQAARRLREEAGRLSLVPAEEVLGPLARMARDLAREEGHEVALRLEHLDLQADRGLLQALRDPVLHMLRNAIGHGLEPPAERAAKGKPERAEIGLRLASRGGRLLVTVFDDGRGPDLDRIEAVAVRRGLLPPRAPGEPPRPADQLLALVFEPGFSTAAEVDRLSGRGMGLSVVAEAARALRGGAQLRPRRPWGAEVEIAVPLSAALQPLLLVEAGGRRLGLPTHGIVRLMRLPREALEQVEGRPVVRIAEGDGDVVVPLVALSSLLGSHDAPPFADTGHILAVLLRRGARRCAVAVEALTEVRTLMVGEADTPGTDAGIVIGAALLEDEAPVLVLSPEGLVGRWMREEGRLAASGLGLAAPGAAPQRAAPTILVVDDSITTRTLEKSILEAQGYRVLLSVDGLDALAVLRGGEAVVDLVIADVEMPRMDGFALLQAMKTDPRLAPVPVILMTSRTDPADVRRGLELGASAYVTKQTFDQGELLATIGRLL